MGFLAGYYALAIPRLLFHVAFTLYYIKTTMCWALHFVGLHDSGEPDSSSWRDFPDINSFSVPSISADTIRDNLPVVTFGKFAERFCESIGDDLMCAVCLNSFEEEEHIRELRNCYHIFHRNCLDKWLDHCQTTCPLCRSSLMPERILDTERNCALFEDARPSWSQACHKILANFTWRPSTVRSFPHRSLNLDLPEGHSIAFFDGAAQSDGSCCGAGGFFKSHQSRITNWFINGGAGTNTRAEFLGLWATLFLAAQWSLDDLHVLGDSKVILDWISNNCKLKSIHLEGWMQQTRTLSKCFSNLNFQHVPRSLNRAADALSKRALTAVIGRLSIYHCDRESESPITTLNIFEYVG